MITHSISIKCDICGADIGMHGGAHVELEAHDPYRAVIATYPPRYPGSIDLCNACRNKLAAWIDDRTRELGVEP